MAQQFLNFGAIPNDGTGDTIRAAMQIIESNISELFNEPEFAKANFGDSATGNYIEIDEYGTLRFHGTTTVWDDIQVPVNATNQGGSKDPGFGKIKDNGSASQGVFTYLFDAATEEELYFSVQMPHGYKEGSDIKPHVHWMPTANGAAGADVCWGLEYTWVNIGDVMGNTSIIYGDTNHLAEDLVDDRQYITSLGTIDGTGKKISSMLMCRIFRDATGVGGTDDYASDAALLEIDIHFEKDSFGSNGEYTKDSE